MILKLYSKIILGIVLFVLSSMVANADFRVCNATQNLVGVAIGYRAPNGWVSEGWWRIGPTRCETIIEGPLSSRFYYLHAEDSKMEGRWGGPVTMCLKDAAFKIDGVNDCFTRGFQKGGFQEIDTGTQTSWMVQLTEPSASHTTSPSAKIPGSLTP